MVGFGLLATPYPGREFDFSPSLLVSSGVCDELNATYVSVLLSAWTSLLFDSPLNSSCGIKPFKVVNAFYKDVMSRPIGETVRKYAKHFDDIASSAYLSGASPLTGDFLGDMRYTPVFKEYHTYFRTGDRRICTYLLSFFRFGKKARYVDAEFDSTAFRGWTEVEDRVNSFSVPDVTALRCIVRALLPDSFTSTPYPKFGPGAVSEDGIRGMIRKAGSLRSHPRLRMALKSVWFSRTGVDPSRVFPNWDSLQNQEFTSTEVSTLRFVPKDVTKARSICMEPNSFMYLQQMVLDWMVHAMEQGDIRKFVSLRDQAQSQIAALHGSTYGSVDTIDLSSASDSVHVDLVKAIFPREYLYWLLATRTSRVRLPDGTIRSVKKFAPMGSALCFPVQCIVFTSICLYAMLRHEGTVSSLSDELDPAVVKKFIRQRIHSQYDERTPYGKKFERLTVYGDDISCDSRVTEGVVLVLEQLGFRVNGDKSFKGSQAFRESCGVYAFNGQDVTPLTFKPSFFSRGIDALGIVSLIDLLNLAGDYGYRNLRRHLIQIVRYAPVKGYEYVQAKGRGNPIPYVTDRSLFGIYTVHSNGNPHLVKGWNSDWQRYEERGWGVRIGRFDTPDSKSSWDVEQYLYVQDQRRRRGGIQAEIYSLSRRVPQETRLHWVWSPVD